VLPTEAILRARFRQVEVVWPGDATTATVPMGPGRGLVGVATVTPDSEGEGEQWKRRGVGGTAGLRRERYQIRGIG
jgi:hypothetical protein